MCRLWSNTLAVGFAIAALTRPAMAQGHGNEHDKANAHAQGHADMRATPPQAVQVAPPARGEQKIAVQEHGGAAHGRSEVRDQRIESNGRIDVPPGNKLTGRANAALRQETNPGIGQAVSSGEVVKGKFGRSIFVRQLRLAEVRPVVRTYVVSTRPAENLAGSALAYALARGVPENTFMLVPVQNTIVVRNRQGVTLLALDDAAARSVGAFRVVPVALAERADAPAFCRSGAGHPVFGRQWCIDKGFGLGSTSTVRWGRIIEPVQLVLQPTTVTASPTALIATDILRSLLGNTVFDRLALHALTLGYADPLVGRWLGETTGPRTLLVTSGPQPVAEIVDTNRNNQIDNLLVALRPW